MYNFIKNMECIERSNPKLFYQINDRIEKTNSDRNRLLVNTQISRDGNHFLTVTRDGMEYRMNSNYRPLEEAIRWSNQYKFGNINKVIHMFGFGNGYCIRELLKKINDNEHIIIVEPSFDLFLHVLDEYDITDIIQDVRVRLTIVELDTSMLAVFISELVHWINLKSQIICIHPQYDKCFYIECKNYLKSLEEHNYRILINRNTEAYFGRDLVKNTILNYRYIPYSNYLLELKGKIRTDIPAIIVAAGPSLDLNIDELKRAKGKSVIFATDTALRYLYRHGIKPDVVVTLDPKKPPSYFDNVDFENIPLFCSSEANHEALLKHEGRKIWFVCHNFINTMYHEFDKYISRYNPGGSVATAAFSICKSLGFETIILIGQDLAYKGEVTHADGDICNIHNEEDGICYVEGIDGKLIKSRHDWDIYRKWFENSILETEGSGIVIDATEGGAKIRGTQIMTLSDAIDRYCHETFDFSKIIEGMPVTFHNEELLKIYSYLEKAYEEIQVLPKKAEEIVALCTRGIKELKNANQSGKLTQIGRQIVEMNNQISKEPVYALIDSIIKHDVLNEIQEMCVINKDENGPIQTYESTKKIFISVGKAIIEIEPLLREAVDEFKQYVRSEKNAEQ